MLLRTVPALLCIVAMVGPSFAQDHNVTPPPERCRAEPIEPGNTNVDPNQTGSTSLTEKLDPCNGVLKPPDVGDREMNKRPPDTGEMREVKPRDLPGQQSNPEQE